MTTKQELETALRERIRAGMSPEEIRSATEAWLREALPTTSVVVEDAGTADDREHRRMRATVHIRKVPLETAADLLAADVGAKVRIAGSLELARYEPTDILVTVCSVCRRAGCWHGTDFCDEAKEAATVDVRRSMLIEEKREHADAFSDSVLDAVGNVEEPPACEICGDGFEPGALVVEGYGEAKATVHADCYLTSEKAALEDCMRAAVKGEIAT